MHRGVHVVGGNPRLQQSGCTTQVVGATKGWLKPSKEVGRDGVLVAQRHWAAWVGGGDQKGHMHA